MLVVIPDRALTGEEYDEVFDWVHQTYNYLEEVLNSERTTDQNAIEEAITLFKSNLMELCVDLMYRQPASEKVRSCLFASEKVRTLAGCLLGRAQS